MRLRRAIARSIAVAVLGVGLAALLTPARAAEPVAVPAGPHPVIEVRETTQDGGAVEEGTVVRYRFTVENQGDADLQVTQVRPSCGCTAPHWEKLIKPHGKGMIEAEFNSSHFHGPITKHLTVFSNDPQRPQLELTITARVNPLVQVTPSSTAMLSVADKPVTYEFTLERSGGHPMKIVKIIPNAPYLTAEATPLRGEGRYKLTVTATTDAPFGRTTVPLVVQTDLEKAGMLTLVLTVDRGIVTTPPVLFYGQLPTKMTGPMLAAVTVSRSMGSFHVTSATVDDPKLAVRLDTVRDGGEYRVTVTYSGGWEPGLVHKTLTINTDDAKQPAFQIPIQGFVQDKPGENQAAAVPQK
jgi:hypothetical protein